MFTNSGVDYSKKEDLDLRIRQLKEAGMPLVSYRALQMGSRFALELVSKQTMHGKRDGFALTCELRAQKLTYLFVMLFDGKDPALAQATMDKILGQFKILSDEPVAAPAASQPAGK